MEVTYSQSGDDLLWLVARDWLAARRLLVQRAAWTAFIVALLPLLLAAILPTLRHFIIAMWLVDIAFFVAAVVVLLAVARRFFAPFLQAAYGPASGRLSIGPDCVLEIASDSVAVPWEYVRGVSQDPLMVYIILDNGFRHAIPRSAFETYAQSIRFGYNAWRYWHTAHPGSKRLPRSFS